MSTTAHVTATDALDTERNSAECALDNNPGLSMRRVHEFGHQAEHSAITSAIQHSVTHELRRREMMRGHLSGLDVTMPGQLVAVRFTSTNGGSIAMRRMSVVEWSRRFWVRGTVVWVSPCDGEPRRSCGRSTQMAPRHVRGAPWDARQRVDTTPLVESGLAPSRRSGCTCLLWNPGRCACGFLDDRRDGDRISRMVADHVVLGDRFGDVCDGVRDSTHAATASSCNAAQA